ncbi:MAG: bifunctional proline dehydrogenase/L-glutamate gamma-semialdehyde dehydrogenase PutA [Pseudomonadales bacterium]
MPESNLDSLRERIRQSTYTPEAGVIDQLLSTDQRTQEQIRAAQDSASALILACRADKEERSLLDAFLDQFGLSTEEGVALMCLAESVVRIPDQETADDLIADKVGSGERWRDHLGASDSLLVNASTWALMLTGEVVELGNPVRHNFGGWLGQLVNRLGEPVIRQSLRYAMKLLGNEFVFATTANEAVAKAEPGALYSFDMLGEAARTEDDAANYLAAYERALAALHPQVPMADCLNESGISVKLSALYPRYETAHENAVIEHLYPRLVTLAEQAAADNLQLTIDAEEAHRLDLSLTLLQRLCQEPALANWQGLGLALQAYGKRALPTIDFLQALATHHDRRLIVRLVKGAYWDSEIKHAQQLGVSSYPVFTTKSATDLSYIACAQRLLEDSDAFYPQFATHNAHSLANVLMLGAGSTFELQRLHGMGELLYSTAQKQLPDLPRVRTYAPVGPHKHLMAYLIRRLLENGANSSFVNRFLDEDVPIARLVRNTRNLVIEQTTNIPAPADLYAPERQNARGYELGDPAHLATVRKQVSRFFTQQWGQGERDIRNPANTADIVGWVTDYPAADLPAALEQAQQAQPAWDALGAERASILERIATLYDAHRFELLALLIREAGKTYRDALDELREAIDFCRYYAAQCRAHFAAADLLPGPTGERNELRLHGRGVFACISPWNFPLAIFSGQITAALAAGNGVLAKPAEQTPLIAERAVALMLEAGVPADLLCLVHGDGSIGAAMVNLPQLAGVTFTGSTAVAKHIQQALAAKPGPIVPLIAETGGQNAMIVDSTAMLEQVCDDVIRSAFGSAGQRCSALRILCVQQDIAEETLIMLQGAMDLLRVGNPQQIDTDVGPIIDRPALLMLQDHCTQMAPQWLHATPLDLTATATGHFLPPQLLRIDRISELDSEQFGPILHVLAFERNELAALLADLHATGYGLTLGIHSRNSAFIEQVYRGTRAGNVYVNRNMIGAVVGVQPFGGAGLSGTGPKAGGPHYLPRFATERTFSDNVAAIGGNLDLLTAGKRAET